MNSKGSQRKKMSNKATMMISKIIAHSVTMGIDSEQNMPTGLSPCLQGPCLLTLGKSL